MEMVDGTKLDEKHHRNSDPWPRPRERFPVVPDEKGRCWHAVHSDTKHVGKTCEAIDKLGYKFYYPQMRRMKTPALRNVTPSKRRELKGVARPVLSPLFPGYPFVLFSLRDGQWHELFDLFGVYGMKVAEGLPVPVPNQVIANIQASEVGGAIPLEMPVVTLLFGAGERVRIEDGPFHGFTGTIQELDESRRRVLLDLVIFGASRPVPFEIDQISKL